MPKRASLEKVFVRVDHRPRWLLGLALLSMLVGAGTALVVIWITGGALFCTTTRRLSGADVPRAAAVVLIACSLGFVTSIVVRDRPVLLALTLSLTACALLTGIALVARDSAVTKAVETCTLVDTTTETETDHVWSVYVFWGVALVLLLLQLRRAIRFSATETSAAG
jgi:hypothetical protein